MSGMGAVKWVVPEHCYTVVSAITKEFVAPLSLHAQAGMCKAHHIGRCGGGKRWQRKSGLCDNCEA
jgi:pyruvate/oxaloacetate carboxyltransferase